MVKIFYGSTQIYCKENLDTVSWYTCLHALYSLPSLWSCISSVSFSMLMLIKHFWDYKSWCVDMYRVGQ